jgi:carboxyl-terminal processing protease
MKKLLNTLIVAILLAGSLLVAGYMSQAVAEQKAPDYATELKLFSDILRYVKYIYVTDVEPQKLIHGAIKGMLDQLDPYTQFMSAEERARLEAITAGKFGGIGFEVDLTAEDKTITVVTPIEGTPAERGGLRPRDKILKIDGKSTEGMTLDEAINQMRGEPGTKVTLTIRHHGENITRDLTFTREIIEQHTVRNPYMIAPHIGYVRLTDWAETSQADLEKALGDLTKQGMTKLILDIRSNSGGLLISAVNISNMFLEGRKMVVYTQGKLKDKWHNEYYTDGSAKYGKLPFVLLVDSYSASASEIFAGAMKDWGRAKIMGMKTYGKAAVQNLFDLTELGTTGPSPALKMTVAYYYTPKGTFINGEGIHPDIELEPVKYDLIVDKLFFDEFYRRFAENLYDELKPKAMSDLPTEDVLLAKFKDYIKAQKFHFYPEQYEATLPDNGMEFAMQQVDKNRESILKLINRELIYMIAGEEDSQKYWRDQDPWIKAALKELG